MESIDDQNIGSLMVAACPGSSMSLGARPPLYITHTHKYQVTHVGVKLIRQAQRCVNGEHFRGLETFN